MGAVNTILAALQIMMPDFAKSDASVEGKIIDVVGTFADTEKLERDNTLEVINTALANQKVTTVEYYRRKAVAFQNNDTLVYDPVNQGGYYAVINPEKQIVKQAYIVGAYPEYSLLVNAVASNGHLRVLTADELASFRTYFAAFQPMGLILNIASLEVAKISDPGLIIYIRPGADAASAAAQIQTNLTAHESVLRDSNTVSLTEIEDVIQKCPDVRAVGFDSPIATETNLSGATVQVSPENGVFRLTNGAFTFTTPITTDLIKTLQ